MIDHTGFTVSDPATSRSFYERALAPLGYRCMVEIPPAATGGVIVLGFGAPPKPDFWLTAGTPSTPRVHIAFAASTKEQVDAFYAAALEAGGKDNGAPGPRPQYHPGYYGAFVLDPDGYNVEVVCHVA